MTNVMKNIKDIIIENVSIVKSGRTFRLSYKAEDGTSDFLSFSTNTLYTPFGLNSNQSKFTPNLEYSITASVNASDTESAILTRTKLEALDKHIEDLVLSKKEDMKIDDDFCYTSFYKNSGNYPKLIKFNFVRDANGNFKTIVFDSNKQKIPITDSNIEEIFKRGTLFKAITINKKIWTFNSKVGTIWDLDQILLIDKKENMNENETIILPKVINECIMLDD
jgi:hypothetical protein